MNDYEASTEENYISLNIGIQSTDISIDLDDSEKTWPLVSEKLVLTPSLNSETPESDISFTSWFYNFTFY